MIPFNKPTSTGAEKDYVLDALNKDKLSGDGFYSELCHKWFEVNLNCNKALLTPSCTQALEMAAILIDLEMGDEVIMPSFTFVSTANAFVLRGAKIIFVDIRPDTMNINEALIENAITNKTKAIVVVHYAGVACDMSKIMSIANQYNLFVIEDAAQAMMSKYNSKPLGTIGHLGTYSFHETKNYTSGGEGGVLLINDKRFINRAEIIREKGTNRNQFFRGMVDKYTWSDIGSSYLPSELQAAYLYAQLLHAETIHNFRLELWSNYYKAFKDYENLNYLTLPTIPKNSEHNGHMFYIKVKDLRERELLLNYLNHKGIKAVFHYIPLHSTEFGKSVSTFISEDKYTTSESDRLIRLPIYYGMTENEQSTVIQAVKLFYDEKFK